MEVLFDYIMYYLEKYRKHRLNSNILFFVYIINILLYLNFFKVMNQKIDFKKIFLFILMFL